MQIKQLDIQSHRYNLLQLILHLDSKYNHNQHQ